MSSALDIYYFKACDIWKRFCELHQELLELTVEEYQLLLKNKIDSLPALISEKKKIIGMINGLEKMRAALIEEIKFSGSSDRPIKSIADLLVLFTSYREELEQKHLQRFNLHLIHTIEQLSAQNKLNQQFLNRAIRSLKQLKEDLTGKKKYEQYNARGQRFER